MRDIPGYTLGTCLHEGTDVVVFEAQRVPENIPVVLKAARDGAPHAHGTRLVRREIDVLGALDHRAVPKLVDASDDEPAYLASTRAEGSALRTLLAECPPPWPGEAIAELGIQIADVLAHVHNRGFAYGDLKPEHVFVSDEGRVTVVDYGSARRLDEKGAPGTYDRGTPAYAPPEQALGDALDARSDLYALGRVLEELGAGALAPALKKLVERMPPNRFASAEDAMMALRTLVPDRNEAREAIVRVLGGSPGSLRGLAIAAKYDLVRSIGRGATGTVYEALDRATHETLAVKIIHRELAGDPAVKGRFAREAAVLSHLRGKHIATLRDWGTVPDPTGDTNEDRTYLAFDFIRGASLREKIAAPAGVTRDRAVHYVRQILEALGDSHAQGVLHRDVKPENVLVAGDDEVTVVDFGLAKLVQGGTGTTGLTARNVVFGTPRYMSPEAGRGDEPGAPSDLYSVGVVLYELLTGSVPFRARTAMATLAAHSTDLPETPRARAPERDIPVALEAVVLRALEKDPAARFASAGAFKEALDAAALSTAPTHPVAAVAAVAAIEAAAEANADAAHADTEVGVVPPKLASLPAAATDTSPSNAWTPGTPSSGNRGSVPDPPRSVPSARAVSTSAPRSAIPRTQRRPNVPPPSRENLVWFALALFSVAIGTWFGLRR